MMRTLRAAKLSFVAALHNDEHIDSRHGTPPAASTGKEPTS
jgi:hypothetical protein